MKRKFLYSEAKLCEVTGLSREQLKKCRVKGEWRYGQRRWVHLSEKGVRRVLERFGIQDANLDGARLDFGSNGSRPLDPKQDTRSDVTRGLPPRVHDILPDPECARNESLSVLPALRLVHVSQIVPNKRILRAKNGTGEVLNVIVPSSEVFAVGDPLRVKQSERHQGYFELVGKAPRWRSDRMYRLNFQTEHGIT